MDFVLSDVVDCQNFDVYSMIRGCRVRILISQAASALPFTFIAVQHSQRPCLFPSDCVLAMVLSSRCFLSLLAAMFEKIHVVLTSGRQIKSYLKGTPSALKIDLMTNRHFIRGYGYTWGDRICDIKDFLRVLLFDTTPLPVHSISPVPRASLSFMASVRFTLHANFVDVAVQIISSYRRRHERPLGEA